MADTNYRRKVSQMGRQVGNFAVNITKRVDTPEGRRFCPVVESANGRIKPDYVVVGASTDNPREEKIPGGTYYIEWRENGERRRESVADASHATARKHAKAAELKARFHGLTVASTDSRDSDRRLISTCATEYLKTKGIQKPRTRA